VEIAWQTAVQGWRTSAGRVTALDTSGGERTADEYVLCAGAWSAVTARDLGLRLPLQAGRGLSLTLPAPPGRLRRGLILSEAHVAVTPMDGALRVGGTLELAGLEATVRPARVRGVVKAAVRYLPDLREEHFAGLRPWCGLRPCSPDGLPYLGRVRRFANLSVATGHAMLGVSLAPVTGRLMAEILSDETPHLDVGALRPDRYDERSRA
jgi:D-amino-acid dehydrogenase